MLLIFKILLCIGSKILILALILLFLKKNKQDYQIILENLFNLNILPDLYLITDASIVSCSLNTFNLI